ncbi:MAG: phage major capsid protein [Armatimonadota bacterium]
MAAGPFVKAGKDIGLYIESLRDVTINSAESVQSKLGLAYQMAKTSKYQDDWLSFAGISPFTTWSGEGQTISRQALSQRFKTTLTQTLYATAVAYTYLNKKFVKYGLMNEQAKELGFKAAYTKEQLGAGYFNRHLAGTGDPWNATEGEYLFSTAHPLFSGGTCSNKQAGALSVTTLQGAISLLKATKDDQGAPMNLMPRRLWVADNLFFTAFETLGRGNPNRGDTDKHTSNAFEDFNIELTVWPFLSDNYWMLQADRFGTVWETSINLDQEQYEDKPTKDTIHQAIFGVAYGARDWRGWVGSNGT